MLKELSNEQGFLKAGFLGFAKSGKTWTATELAIGTRKLFGLNGPIAFFDTESGSGYVAERVKSETGQPLLGVRARSFADLMQFAKDCVEAKVSVAIVDSITHVWQELTDSFLQQLNQKRREKNWAPIQKLEFQHWSSIKSQWASWPNAFLNLPLHIIVCGRAAYIYDYEKDAETGKRELVKSGTKMKVEVDFGFESSLLVEMEREEVPDGNGSSKLMHRATILGDRFGRIDAATTLNPTFDFFKPHVELLRPGSHAPVDTTSRTDTGADVEGNSEWSREQKARTILCEEIQGVIVSRWPGQTSEEKKAKSEIVFKIFNTRSWTKVEGMQSTDLRDGLVRLKRELGIEDPPPPVTDKGDDTDLGPETPASKVRAVLTAKKCSEPELLAFMEYIGSVDKTYPSLEALAAERKDIMESLPKEVEALINKMPQKGTKILPL